MLTAECCLLIFKGFSAERLLHFLNALGHDVEIRIRRKPRLQPKNAKNARFGDPGLKRAAGIFVTTAVVAFRRRSRGERHQGGSAKTLRPSSSSPLAYSFDTSRGGPSHFMPCASTIFASTGCLLERVKKSSIWPAGVNPISIRPGFSPT